MLRRRLSATSVAALAIVVAVVCAFAGGPMAASGQARPSSPASEFVRMPTGWQLNRGPNGPMRTEVALSPDGTSIVFSASPDGTMPKAMIYRQSVGSPEATVFPGTAGGCMPAFSPDGQWIVYWGNRKLHKVALKGGAPEDLSDVTARPFGLAWAPDGRIIFGKGSTTNAGLAFLPSTGGTPADLTKVDAAQEGTHRLPHMLPGGKALLFTSMFSTVGREARVEWLSLETGKRKVLVEDGADARYLSSGHLVFVRRGALMAAPFDVGRLQTTGPAVVAIPGLMQNLNGGAADMNSAAGQYTVSDTGGLIWVPGGASGLPGFPLYWVDRSGKAEPWSAFGRSVGSARVSPDGSRLVFASGPSRGLELYDIQKNAVTNLMPEGQGWIISPFWAPGGKRVVFSWWRTGLPNVWSVAMDGTGKTEQLTRSEFDQRVSCMSRDGRFVAVLETHPDTSLDIEVLDTSTGKVTPFVATKATERFPEFSPDARWMAYVSDESGRSEVYLRSFPDGRKTVPISSDGGVSPVWAPGGRELFFWDIAVKTLMKVDIVPGENLSAGAPSPLFQFNAASTQMIRNYDISPDGTRFLIKAAQPATSPVAVTQLNLARNWFADLKRLSPNSK